MRSAGSLELLLGGGSGRPPSSVSCKNAALRLRVGGNSGSIAAQDAGKSTY
jgi:hypothetical protein